MKFIAGSEAAKRLKVKRAKQGYAFARSGGALDCMIAVIECHFVGSKRDAYIHAICAKSGDTVAVATALASLGNLLNSVFKAICLNYS